MHIKTYPSVLAAIVLMSLATSALDARENRRTMPPAQLQCERSLLTSYQGEVTKLERDVDQVRLVIATDWDTEETVLLKPACNSPESRFLLHGAPFSADDWRKIESSPGVPVPGLRVTAWICQDGTTLPLINWLPPEKSF